jgi:hypothetical protein
VTPIDILPDDVLLTIFDFHVNYFEYLHKDLPRKDELEVWQLLVHVCQRWRSVVFGSPRFLNLQLVCTPRTPVLETLDVWPALPLVVHCYGDYPISGVYNILAALKYHDRIRKINIQQEHSEFPWEGVQAVLQAPFPELTELILYSDDEYKNPVFFDTFLGGSAPRLQLLNLAFIHCPGLPLLLLSTTHLVHLSLCDTPFRGCMAPEVMASCLSTLTSLESLYIEINDSLLPLPPKSEPPSTRTVLPALTLIIYEGLSSLLEDIVAHIDCPKLNKFTIYVADDYDPDPEMSEIYLFVSRTPSLQEAEIIGESLTRLTQVCTLPLGPLHSRALIPSGKSIFWEKLREIPTH